MLLVFGNLDGDAKCGLGAVCCRKHERITIIKPRSNPASSRDAETHAEAIIAPVLALAVVGTEKQNAPKYVVDQYKKVLQELRASDSGAFN